MNLERKIVVRIKGNVRNPETFALMIMHISIVYCFIY
jgi:hypothetical protein